jgi:hypothetical protein
MNSKSPFYRLMNPEEMINRICNPNSPPNDPSSSEYSQNTTLELRNSKLFPNRWLFNPAAAVRKTVLPICNLPKAIKIPKLSRAPAATLPAKSFHPDLPAPLPATPERLVASGSEMAPKRSELEGKKKEAQPPTREWTYSKCSPHDLDRLVSEGLVQDRNLVNWRPSFREPFPMENVDEIVTFYHFVERGLALPSCSFFRGLLYYYGLELHHLNPNSICHISIFIYFCEAFLGIEPHWDLFHFLFRIKPQPTSKNLSVAGGTGIQLRQQAGDKYLSYKFPSNLPGWKNHWFYIKNHAPPTPSKIKQSACSEAGVES